MQIIEGQNNVETFSIALIISRFNEPVTQALYEGALQRLHELKFPDHQITVVWVPGAVEIPIVAKHLAKMEGYEAIVALGAVIRGETGHYDYVCQQVSHGCQVVALEFDIPVIFGVLTTDNAEQAFARCGGKKGHKGKESIDAAVEMVSVLRQIES